MNQFFVNGLDLFFVGIMGLLYIAFVFFAKNLRSKFFIFFISSFINIFNYSIVLNNEYSFFTIVLLNIIFILIVMIFYIFLNREQKNLPSSFIESNDIKNTITVLIFSTSFIILCFIFILLNVKKDRFKIKNDNYNILTNVKLYEKDKNNNIQKKEIFINEDYKYIVYSRNLEFIEKNKIFSNYNLLILLYISTMIVMFFITNKKNRDLK